MGRLETVELLMMEKNHLAPSDLTENLHKVFQAAFYDVFLENGRKPDDELLEIVTERMLKNTSQTPN